MNFNNRVSFNEFSKGIETLKVKITLKEQLECFNYLDTDQKQYINYDKFTGLAVERRSKIDPAKDMLELYKRKSTQ
jgi:Ca2+-binding EF-hand superfamily protein